MSKFDAFAGLVKFMKNELDIIIFFISPQVQIAGIGMWRYTWQSCFVPFVEECVAGHIGLI